METAETPELFKAGQVVRGVARYHSTAVVSATGRKGPDDTGTKVHASHRTVDRWEGAAE